MPPPLTILSRSNLTDVKVQDSNTIVSTKQGCGWYTIDKPNLYDNIHGVGNIIKI